MKTKIVLSLVAVVCTIFAVVQFVKTAISKKNMISLDTTFLKIKFKMSYIFIKTKRLTIKFKSSQSNC